jgi:hypothetical protein
MLNKKPILHPNIHPGMLQRWPPSAAPQTLNLVRNPNPTDQEEEEEEEETQKETLGGMPVHTQKWQPLSNGDPPLLL